MRNSPLTFLLLVPVMLVAFFAKLVIILVVWFGALWAVVWGLNHFGIMDAILKHF